MRRYFLRGIHGHASAMSYAFFRYLRLAKHVEARRNKDSNKGNPGFAHHAKSLD